MNPIEPNPPDRLERALQASLRPVDPGSDFLATLQARLAAGTPNRMDDAPGRRPRRVYAASLALAASIVVALVVGWQMQDLRAQQDAAQVRQEQARAQTQLLLALEITSERLGLVQQRIEQYQSREKSL